MFNSRHNITKYIILIAGSILVLTFCEKPERDVQVVTLGPVDSLITYYTAKLKGELTDLGSDPVEDHGLFLSLNNTPDNTNSTIKSLGTKNSKGVFEGQFSGLLKNTLYYYCAYVKVKENISSGTVFQFRTKDTQPATVTAGTISEVTINSAKLSGNVISDGGETVTKRGLCWNISPNPTITSCLDTTVNGSGTGSFTGMINGLSPSTQYYARVYAINAKGTSYNSSDITFTTFNLPTVTTTVISSVTGTSAISGGNVSNEGGTPVTVRGVCWSTSPAPTTALPTKTTDGTGPGNFASNITGLSQGTRYYVRAYATNQIGTAYGNELSFTTAVAPTAFTNPATSLTATSATLNGSVNPNNYSTDVTFEYGPTTSYGLAIPAVQSPVTGTIQTDVSANIFGLTQGTTYHYKIKAVNAGGTTEGGDITFTTPRLPVVTVSPATGISSSSATLNGIVNPNDLPTNVIFEYGTTATYGSAVPADQSPVSGSADVAVSAGISGLSSGTNYHFRIKAESAAGIVFTNDQILPVAECMFCKTVTYENGVIINEGSEASYCGSDLNTMLNTPPVVVGSLITRTQCRFNDIDGNSYNTVTIGTQVWMKENLKTTKYNDNNPITLEISAAGWAATMAPAYCWYNNDEAASRNTFGALYNWYSVNTGKLCPTGWHMPSDAEWTALTTYLGGENVAGGKLKETGTVHWLSPNAGATNETGFTALPGGYRYNDGGFRSIADLGYWWSSIPNGTGYAWSRKLYSGFSLMLRPTAFAEQFVNNGYSVRCIKDNK